MLLPITILTLKSNELLVPYLPLFLTKFLRKKFSPQKRQVKSLYNYLLRQQEQEIYYTVNTDIFCYLVIYNQYRSSAKIYIVFTKNLVCSANWIILRFSEMV